jgi:hypothetical protein
MVLVQFGPEAGEPAMQQVAYLAATASSARWIPFPVLVVGGVVLAAGGLYLVPSWWRGKRASAPRTFLAYVLVMACGALTGVVILLQESDMIAMAVAKVLAVASLAGFAIFAVAALTIVLFNWPSALVAPHLRRERGRWSRSKR